MPSEKELVSRGMTAIAWGSVGTALRIFMQISSQVVLARILGPELFGLFATAMIALTLVNFFADFGIAYSLIQKEIVRTEDIRFVTTWQFILGCVAAGVMLASAPIFANFFHNDALIIVIQSLAVVCIINAMAAVSTNLLKREINFKKIQIASTTSYAIGYLVIGIILAHFNAGIWALIAAFISTAAINFFVLYISTRHSLRPLLWTRGSAAMLDYGGTVLLTNIVNWVISSIDRTIVGRFFPTASVGYYTTAFNFVYSPCTTLIGILQPALFSTSARMQGQQCGLRLALQGALAATSLFLAPIFVGMATVASTLVVALYGPEWVEMANLLRPLALAMPLMILIGMSTPTLWVQGKIRHEFLLQLPIAAIVAIVCYWASSYSMLHIAWAVLGLLIVRAITIIGFAARIIGVKLREILMSVSGGCAVSAGVSLSLMATDKIARHFAYPPTLSLALEIAVASFSMLLLLLMWPRLLHGSLTGILSRALPRLGVLGRVLAQRLLATRA